MKKTCYSLKLMIAVYAILTLALAHSFSFKEVIVILLIVFVNIYREKYNSAFYVSFAGLALVLIGININPLFGVFFAVSAFDFASSGTPYLSTIPVICEIVFFRTSAKLPGILLFSLVLCLFGFTLRQSAKRENDFKNAFDHERRLRYELEQVKARLLCASKETARLAETQERNRIAREIHDSVGHRTSAVLIQLEAAYKLFDIDLARAKKTVGVCVRALGETMELLRNTVHNIKPQQHLGVEYIKSIIDNFKFCKVNFKFDGDFGAVPPQILQILGTNIMEALTNAQRHSGATAIDIAIDIDTPLLRLSIKDNGHGCENLREGMGLSGMRERINNIGGTMSCGGSDGFMLVFTIPLSTD